MTDALKTVSSGFRLVYIGLLLVVLAVVIGIVGVMILVGGAAGGGNLRAAGQMVVGLLMLVGGLSLAGKVIGLIGRFKCMAIPEKAGGARQMIVVSVAMEVVSLITTLIVLASDVTSGFLQDQVRTVVNAGGIILSLISTIL
ncbi:MAG TPA: hypothetical protein VLM40_02580, partial [Gemmata sp.]|nr:hypothetical protein [Gemmata sp.]